MANLTGVQGEQSIIVNDNTAVTFLDHPGARVLGTPWMILWMERTSRDSVKPLLPPGWDTVGTTVNIRHCAAAPFGARVTFRSQVIEQSPKRLLFQVSAECDGVLVGDGTHERALIDIDRFAAGLARRSQNQGPENV